MWERRSHALPLKTSLVSYNPWQVTHNYYTSWQIIGLDLVQVTSIIYEPIIIIRPICQKYMYLGLLMVGIGPIAVGEVQSLPA